MRANIFGRLLLIACLMLLVGTLANAQVPSITDLTSTPIPGAGHDYNGLLNETASPLNGSVDIRIGTPTSPGRRIKLPFVFAYNSNGVYYTSADDDGPNHMNNVNKNENPIRHDLGLPKRTKYEPAPDNPQ